MIDYAFITAMEGYCLEGYIPDSNGSRSGVTIGSGFDIGQRNNAELERDFSADLATKLIPYANKIGAAAQLALELQPLILDEDEVTTINKVAHRQSTQRLLASWQKAPTFCDFDQLSPICQTVIASVAFQYGHLPLRTPNFWSQVTQGDWAASLANLRNFGDRYPTRRNKEADLLETFVGADQKRFNSAYA